MPKIQIFQETWHARSLLKLLDKMYKYQMDPTRTVGTTERTQNVGWTDGGTDVLGKTHMYCDENTDGRSETNIPPPPPPPPQQLRCAGGINICALQYCCLFPNKVINSSYYIRILLLSEASLLFTWASSWLSNTGNQRATMPTLSSMVASWVVNNPRCHHWWQSWHHDDSLSKSHGVTNDDSDRIKCSWDFKYFQSRKCIWKSHLHNVSHFVQASVCEDIDG